MCIDLINYFFIYFEEKKNKSKSVISRLSFESNVSNIYFEQIEGKLTMKLIYAREVVKILFEPYTYTILN